MVPDFPDQTLLRLLHAIYHLLPGNAAREIVGIRQQDALGSTQFDDGARRIAFVAESVEQALEFQPVLDSAKIPTYRYLPNAEQPASDRAKR